MKHETVEFTGMPKWLYEDFGLFILKKGNTYSIENVPGEGMITNNEDLLVVENHEQEQAMFDLVEVLVEKYGIYPPEGD